MNDKCEVCEQFIGYPDGRDHEHCIECQERIPFDDCDGDVDYESDDGRFVVVAGSTKGKETDGDWECYGCIRFRSNEVAA